MSLRNSGGCRYAPTRSPAPDSPSKALWIRGGQARSKGGADRSPRLSREWEGEERRHPHFRHVLALLRSQVSAFPTPCVRASWRLTRAAGTSSLKIRAVRNRTHSTGRTEQPQVHYFVGGATKAFAPRFIACARSTSRSCVITAASRPPGRSTIRRWSRMTSRPNASMTCSAKAASTAPSRSAALAWARSAFLAADALRSVRVRGRAGRVRRRCCVRAVSRSALRRRPHDAGEIASGVDQSQM
jgi:hypothetical protein